MISAIPLEIVLIEDGGCHIFLKCELEKGVIAELILDTGASKTVYDFKMFEPFLTDVKDNESIESSGISEANLSSKSGLISKMKFGDLLLENETIILMDLGHINNLYKRIDKRKIWGLLGGDFLLRFKVNIDYSNKLLIINH
ncbi:hypothetical protein ACFLSY_08070 [Bacteroidota bacterium]